MTLAEVVDHFVKDLKRRRESRVKRVWRNPPFHQELRIELDYLHQGWFIVADLIHKTTGKLVSSSRVYRIDEVGWIYPIRYSTSEELPSSENVFDWYKAKG